MKKLILILFIFTLNSCVVIKHDCTCKQITPKWNGEFYIIKDNPNFILSGSTIVSDSLIKRYEFERHRYLINNQ